jgi:hypothetical protein
MSGQAIIATSPKFRLKREVIVPNHLETRAMSGQAKIATSPKSRLKREIIVLNHLDFCNKSYALYTFGPSLQQRIAIALSPWEIWLPCTAFLQN